MVQITNFCQESLEKYVMSKNNDISDSLPLFVVAGSWNAFFWDPDPTNKKKRWIRIQRTKNQPNPQHWL